MSATPDIELAAVIDRVRDAASAQRPLAIRGNGTKAFYGRPVSGDALDTRHYHGIVEYEPAELYVTARCGTRLADLEHELATHDQMLAFEPPHFGDGTVGGAVATGFSGPRRATGGALRDAVLGIGIIDGRGQDLRFGGRVMKNVAGFDVSRLMAGALGTLGVITEATFKVLPRPFVTATLTFDADEAQAIRSMNEWAGRSLPITGTCYRDRRMWVRLEGAASAIDAARRHLGGTVAEDGNSFWRSLREQMLPFFHGDGPLWRLSVPSAAPPVECGPTLIEWGGAQRWVRNAPAEAVRSAARTAGGYATLFRTRGDRSDVFTPLSPAIAKLHGNLKREFDPRRILNIGRMYADL